MIVFESAIRASESKHDDILFSSREEQRALKIERAITIWRDFRVGRSFESIRGADWQAQLIEQLEQLLGSDGLHQVVIEASLARALDVFFHAPTG